MTQTPPGIQRGDGVALWRQIAERLAGDIASGIWQSGDRLPPESDLADRFGVNRHTVRRAIAALAGEGILRADQGRGTFIQAQKLQYPIGVRTRFSEIVSAQAREPGGRLIGSTREPASVELAEQLALAPGTELLRIEHMRVADDVPVSIATCWYPADRFPHFIAAYAETGSVTKAFARHGVTDYRRLETRISAELSDHRDSTLMGLPPGQPILVTHSLNVDPDGTPIEVTRARMRADSIELLIRP